MPPRTALGYLFLPALILLQKIELIKNKNSQIKECGVFLQKLAGDFSLDSPSSSNPAKQYALKLYRKIPLLYAETGIMEIVAKRWKTQLNENSKVPAFVNVFPELNHNEIVGWETNPPWLKKIIVLYFSDVKTHPRNTRRVRITRELMKDRIDAFLEIGRKENSLLTRVFASVYLGDFVSFYLALLNKQDPTEIKAIDYLKSKLAQYK
jgi:glucose/mannose-6-phosphate isomerase